MLAPWPLVQQGIRIPTSYLLAYYPLQLTSPGAKDLLFRTELSPPQKATRFKEQPTDHGEAHSNQTPVAVAYENDARVRGFGK